MAGAATVEKALDVLFHLHDAEGSLGLGEIARALGLAKSSCHRLLAALAARELVEQDASGRYRPGLALLSLGLGVQRREPVVERAREFLETEAAALGETVFLVAERRGTLRVLDKCEGSGFLRAAPAVGDVIPADVTAAGKLYRAYAVERPDPAPSAGPTGDPVRPDADGAALSTAEREAIRKQGYAVNRDAWIEGLSVLAVPIAGAPRAGSPPLAAVIALAAASTRFEALGEAQVAERLIAAAAAIGERLGAARAQDAHRNLAVGARRPAGGRKE